MYWIARTTAVVTMVALVLRCSLPALAATGATIEGTVEIPCDPSRVSDVVLVQIRPVSGGDAATAAVDSSTGKFFSPALTEGEYEIIVIDDDGQPLSPEPTRLVLDSGMNTIVLSLEPPGCGEQESDRGAVGKPGKKTGLKDWHITVIYVGVIAAIIIALDDDEDPASPF